MSIRPHEYVPNPQGPRDHWGSRPCQTCPLPRKNQIHITSAHDEDTATVRDRILGENEQEREER